MSEILELARFGNPILRSETKKLSLEEISSEEIQTLIENMRYTLIQKEYGVGIAAPQVGLDVSLSVIGIKPTPNRPNLEPFSTVIINPTIIETFGDTTPMWEGCVSCGTGDDILYAKVPRFEEIELGWIDETGKDRRQKLGGFVAHVAQHEVDHLNGVLFVDHVVDPTSFMMGDEYRKRIIHK
jgi:peptide deformylase